MAGSWVRSEHPRAGDIVYVLRADDDRDDHGIVGGCYDDSSLPLGGGTHGGLSVHELHNVCVAFGPDFRQGHDSFIPSGTIDIMPTLLHLLGYDIPATVDGRVLSEALARPLEAVDLTEATVTYSSEAAGDYTQHLTARTVGAATYVDRGWVDC